MFAEVPSVSVGAATAAAVPRRGREAVVWTLLHDHACLMSFVLVASCLFVYVELKVTR